MQNNVNKLLAPNVITVGIDSFTEFGDYAGMIWQPYDVRPVTFDGAMDMILQLDNLYDRWNYPQKALNSRSFRRDAIATQPINIRKGQWKMSVENIQNNRGKKGTFIVQVQYRQNATWQGQVVWAEKNKKEYFRSALELVKLIDGAMEETNGVTKNDSETA